MTRSKANRFVSITVHLQPIAFIFTAMRFICNMYTLTTPEIMLITKLRWPRVIKHLCLSDLTLSGADSISQKIPVIGQVRHKT